MRRLWPVFCLLSSAAIAQDVEVPDEEEAAPDPAIVRFENPAFPATPPPVEASTPGPALSQEALAPYFADGALAEAKTLFDAGSFSRAFTALEGAPATPPAQFLRALAAHRAGDWKFSAKAFEALAEKYPPLRERCLVHAGWGYEQLRQWDDAVRVFLAVRPDSRLTPDARIGLARAYRWSSAKKALEVLTEYLDRPAPAWGRDVGAEALLAAADLHAARKDEKAERAALEKLWARHPLSKEAIKAEPRLGDLSSLGAETVVTRAEALIEAHRNQPGVELLTPLISTLPAVPDPLACRAQFALGKGYRKLRQHQKAVATLAPLKKCKDPELKARALFTLGFSQTISAPALAAGTYEQLAAAFPGHPTADDALFFAADNHLRRDERDAAIDRLLELVDRYPRGDFAADALFKLFWISRSAERFDEALEFLAEIEGRWALADDSTEVERAHYWRARTLEALTRGGEALDAYEALATEHPATYYGLLARERLTELDPERGMRVLGQLSALPAARDPFPLRPGPLAVDPRFQSAVELLRLGFGELVPMEVLSIDRTALPPESLRAMVLVLSLAGEQRSAHGLARLWLRKDLSGRITEQTRPLWEIAYPNAFRELVVTHTAAADELDPDLLQALMREESALDPRALSWAGALGLCQLMPATAAGVAAQLKLKRPAQAALLEPELNIRLGARYLSDLLIRMNGVKPFALASYNAGESAVARWRRENGDADLAAWVEQVPLQETRGYVKRVLRSYNTYKLLYAPGELAKTVTPFKARPPPTPPPARKSG